MCVDMCVGMYLDTCRHVYRHIYRHACRDILEICVGMPIGMSRGVCIGMSIGRFKDMFIHPPTHMHATCMAHMRQRAVDMCAAVILLLTAVVVTRLPSQMLVPAYVCPPDMHEPT